MEVNTSTLFNYTRKIGKNKKVLNIDIQQSFSYNSYNKDYKKRGDNIFLYRELKRKHKISMTHSMRILTKEYLNYHKPKITHDNYYDLLNSSYFYWLRKCAERNYLWCDRIDEQIFSHDFNLDTKNRFKYIFDAVLRNHIDER